MIAKKYHAIAFLSILVMLLLLGLQLLGLGFGGAGREGAAASRLSTAAGLARNSSTASSSNQQQVYRHPISYDKLTGATNNQISEVLGAPDTQQQQFPIDHYQRQQQSQQQPQRINPFGPQQQPFPSGMNPFNPLGNDDTVVDPFGNARMTLAGPSAGQRSPPIGFPGPPHLLGHGPPMGHHHPHHHQNGFSASGEAPGPPPPPAPPMPPSSMGGLVNSQQSSTTQAPTTRHQQQQQVAAPFDSLPAATSTNMASNSSQQQQPAYYTPPIFTYSQFPGESVSGQPPLGVPAAPLSVDEYNRLRPPPSNQQQAREPSSSNNNLLADPAAQQRHRQQMLSLAPHPSNHHTNNNNNHNPHQHHHHPNNQPYGMPLQDSNQTYGYYPDPALYGRPTSVARPPYAVTSQPPVSLLEPVPTPPHSHNGPKQNGVQSRIMTYSPPPPTSTSSTTPISTNNRPTTQSNSRLIAQPQSIRPLQQGRAASEPLCAKQQGTKVGPTSSLEFVNSSTQMPIMFCNEDSEYPTNEIMQALEHFAVDRSIEQILPQQLVQLLLTASAASGTNGNNGPAQIKGNNNQQLDFQRQLVMDPLQWNIDASSGPLPQVGQEPSSAWFPSGNYEPMCKAATYMAQPQRAKNLVGQWKVVVNLPGHKYRGIAVSQMVRIEECNRPNSECSGATTSQATTPSSTTNKAFQLVPRSRCLQHYDNQRLLAWSHQQGLHMDLFRVPSACSCHIRH